MKSNNSIYECYDKQLRSIVSKTFFTQLEKVGKETKSELAKWLKAYNKATNAELVAFDANKTELQNAFFVYTKAKEAYDSELAKVVNNTTCSVPTVDGTNDVIKNWNVDTNDNTTTYNTANDLLKGMIAKVAELTDNSLFTVDNITAAGLQLNETVHLSYKDLGMYVSTLYSEFKKSDKQIVKDKESFSIVCGLIRSSFAVSLRFVPDDRLQEAKQTIIAEYLASEDYNVNVSAKVWEHYGFADKAKEIREVSAKVEPKVKPKVEPKVDYKGKVRLLIQAISDTTNRKNFKINQIRHLYGLVGYPLAK